MPMVAILGFCELALDPMQEAMDLMQCVATVHRNEQHSCKSEHPLVQVLKHVGVVVEAAAIVFKKKILG